MSERDFSSTVKAICGRDDRYDPEAYYFVREALDFTSHQLQKPAQGTGRHVSGHELLEGIRKFTLKEYGPMALTVLRSWGIARTIDFGEIVFNLVEAGVLGRTEEDSKEDFRDGYDFNKAFRDPFLPETPVQTKAVRNRRTARTGRPSDRPKTDE